MILQQRQQPFPQVYIQGGAVVAFSPAFFLPAVHPALRYGIHQVLAVAGQRNAAGLLQGAQALDGGQQLHAVVGGHRLPAGKLLFLPLVPQDRPPAAGTGIAGTGAIGKKLHLFFFCHGVVLRFCAIIYIKYYSSLGPGLQHRQVCALPLLPVGAGGTFGRRPNRP